MNTQSHGAAIDPRVGHVRRVLGPYVAAQFVVMIVVQVITWIRGPQIDLIDAFLLVPSALMLLIFPIVYRAPLRKIRFGMVVAHAATFAIVNGSYHLAAFFHVVVGGFDQAEQAAASSWFGVLVAMCGFWAIGLAVHVAGAIASRGFES